MAYLKKIIKKIEAYFQIEVLGYVSEECSVVSIMFLATTDLAKDVLDDQFLYLGLYSEYKEMTAKGHVLLLNSADSSSLENAACKKYLRITQNISMQTLFNVIQDELMHYHQLQLRKDELLHALQRNNGLDEIIKIAHTYIDNPISVCDNSFSIIGCCPALDDDRNLEHKNGKLYLKSPFFKNMIDSKLTDQIYQSHKPFIAKIEAFPYDWVFSGIRINHALVGYVCIRGIVRPFADDDLEFIHMLSRVLSIAMQKNNSYQNPTGLKYEYFLGDLLSGQFDNYEFIKQRMMQLGHPIQPYYHVVVLRFLDSAGRHPSAKYYYDQILTIFPRCMVVLFQDYLTILLPSTNTTLASETQLERFAALLQLNDMIASVSFPFSNLVDTPLYYRQTLTLFELPHLSVTASETGFPNMIDYRSHFLEHVFSLASNKELLRTSIHPDITAILEYDNQNHTEYINTLQAYLYCNRNAVVAAKRLHIHKSTFFYRLSKISDLFGFDMNDGKLLFAYDYSFRLIHFLKMYK